MISNPSTFPLLIVSATRMGQAQFLKEAPLARSLALHGQTSRLRVKVVFDNREGLPLIYNRAIEHVHPEDIVVFCHDDVALDDLWLPERLAEALKQFDVVGVAGCANPKPEHSSWVHGYAATDAAGLVRFDVSGELAGRVRHGVGLDSHLTVYGPVPRQVKLLDGCFLVVRGRTLLQSGLRFDDQFDFHFYDLDFCRQATKLGLRLGAWPLSITHASSGDYGSDGWKANLERYWEKWPQPSHQVEVLPVHQGGESMSPQVAEQFNAANAKLKAERWRDALAGFDAVLGKSPDFASAHLGRARCLVKLGESTLAREAFDEVLRLEPTHYSAWLESGHLLRQMGELHQALSAYQRAIDAQPVRYEAYLGMARVLTSLGHVQSGDQAFADAMHHLANQTPQAERPARLAQTAHRMGQYWLEQGAAEGAIRALQRGLQIIADALNPALDDLRAQLQIDLGEALWRLGKREQALAVLTAASDAQAEPTLARLGSLSFRLNLWQEALAVMRRNLELHPDSSTAHWNLAHLLAECWQMEEAERVLQQAEALAPIPGARSMRASMAGRRGDADAALAFYRELATEAGGSSYASSAAMSSLYSDRLSAQEVADLHRQLFAPLGVGARARGSLVRAPLGGRRLRLGIVSADFHHQHPVNIFMQPVLRELDRSRFEVFVYFTGVSYDDQTSLAKERVEHWVEVTSLNDAQLAKRIDADKIDLLLDLAGHTGQQRMSLFAQRVAPVQATYLGYPGSTGVPNIDWILGDPVVTPEMDDALCSEQVWRLPHVVFCYSPETDYPYPVMTDDWAHRPLTFASFNNVPKLTPHTLRLWAQVLAAVPHSRLLLKAPSFGDKSAVVAFSERLMALGVDLARVEFRGPTGLTDMMAEYADVDIALDPVPYNGGTTSLQALWMGVPVVCKRGSHFVSRMGASFMSAAGLTNWVAENDADYVQIARDMAADRPALLALKRGLRSRLQGLPGWDVVAQTRALEEAFSAMILSQSAQPQSLALAGD